MSRPVYFWLCFENHRPDGLVWSIKTRGRWTSYHHVEVSVPTRTVYKGQGATQPVAYLEGFGRVRVYRAGVTRAAMITSFS